MTQSKDSKPVFNPGQAKWLKSKGSSALDQDQQALLLALTQLEAQTGRELTEAELSAIAQISDQIEDYDADAILAAVSKMVNAPADPKRQTTWPELKQRKK